MADDLSTYWKDLPSRETPLDARTLNRWGGSIQAVADAASLAAVESANARDEALTHVDVITAPADEQVAAYVAGTGAGATRAALDGLRGRRFQALSGLSYHETRLTMGSEHNAINPTSGDAAVLSGGRRLMENVIGGQEGNVNNFEAPNLPADSTGAYDYSVIIGGYDNVLNSLASFIAGQHCLIRADGGGGGGTGGGHHSIFGGSLHEIAAGGFHTIVGGTKNTISSTANGGAILGGEQNAITDAASHAVVSGGKTNAASGSYASVGGGTQNAASGASAAVVGGNQNIASGEGATAGGRQNTADAANSTAFGLQVNPSQPGGLAVANGQFATRGDAQSETFTLRRTTTDATTTALGIAGGSTPAVIDPDTLWGFTIHVAAQNTDPAVEHQAAWKITGAVRRPASGSAQILGTPTVTVLGSNVGAASWTVGLSTGASAVNINVTGEAGKSIRWVARMDVVQVQG